MKHFYKLTEQELDEMPFTLEAIYYEEIARIHAYDTIRMIKACSYPHMTEKNQKEVMAQLSEMAKVEEEKVLTSTLELAKFLKG